MAKKKVGVVVGSIRTGSYSRMVAKALCGLNPDLDCEILEIKQLSMFNQDFEKTPPQDWLDFKQKVLACDAILFVTPEFNRGMPGVLKNSIDVGSRPWGKSVWAGKPAAVVSQSYGGLAGFGSHHQLRQVLMGVGVATMPHPEAYIGNAGTLFDDAGELNNASTKEFLTGFMAAFETWIAQQRR